MERRRRSVSFGTGCDQWSVSRHGSLATPIACLVQRNRGWNRTKRTRSQRFLDAKRCDGMSTGALVVVATPIGNLGDLTPRAVEMLAAADAIACEDTRRTRKLLSHAGIKAPTLLTVNDHSEARQVRSILSRLERGERVAVVTDAGTPGISDPGERLVAAAAAAGIDVEVVPGASAAIAALVVSGL